MNEKRIIFLISMIFFFCMILLGRLAHLQIVQGEMHRSRAESIRLNKVLIHPQRGNISDRNGKIIAREDALWEVRMNYWLFTEPSNVIDRVNYLGYEKSGFTSVEFDALNLILEKIIKYRTNKNISRSRSFFNTWELRQHGLLRREVRNNLKTLALLMQIPYATLSAKFERVENEIKQEIAEKSERMTEKYNRVFKLGASSGFWEDLGRAERREENDREKWRFQDNPLVLVREIEKDTLETLQELDWIFPGIQGVPMLKRTYPFGACGSHLIGYLREIQRIGFDLPEDEKFDLTKSPHFKHEIEKATADVGEEYILRYFRSAKEFEQRFRRDVFRTEIGVIGVEKYFNNRLQGKYGNTIVERDVKGRTRNVIDDIPPESAEDLQLTIDMDLQKAAEDALKSYFEEGNPTECAGAVVMMNVYTGEILAMASFPTYDLQKLMGYSDEDKAYRQKLFTGEFPGKPLFNRALHATVPPGSVFKVMTAIAAVQENELQAPEFWEEKEFGLKWDIAWEKYNQKKGFTDHGVFGKLNLEQAIAYSCNQFFHEQAYKLGYEKLWYWANQFGFGEKTGVKLTEYEAWRKRRDGSHYNWLYPMSPDSSNILESALNGIGQGRLRVTPLQVARFMCAVATRGNLPTPTILLDDAGYSAIKRIKMIDAGWDAIQKGMIGCVEDGRGTARKIRSLRQFRVAGKTGTAQTSRIRDGEELNFGWFAGYAPHDNPMIAFAVYIEDTFDTGANSAGVVAAKVLEAVAESEEFSEYFAQ
ncbi:MAG: hypothetical protein K8S87_06250 [Planctomycetes bacterium]|nr:hypothetical protein [Planctomycetota bacterium]